MGRQGAHDRVHIGLRRAVAQDGQLPLGIGGGAASDLDVLLDGEEVDRGRGTRGERSCEKDESGNGTAAPWPHGDTPWKTTTTLLQ